MAYYAHISNEQYTVADRARLEEARREKDVIETDNRASDEYATLKTAYEDSFTSETLEGLQSDLSALYSDIHNMPAQEEVDAINDAITAEKEVLAAAQELALADVKAKEAEGTEALVTEMAALETSIANTPYLVTHAATGVDEFTLSDGTTTEIDNTLYWEAWYKHHGKVQAVRRMSYNTQGGVHKLGGTPFRKNYAGKGYMYDPVRDAFYAAQPYASWTLDESTCYWQPPTPRPEGMEWYWNEDTTEWVEHRGKPYKSWIYDEDLKQWVAPVEKPNDGSNYNWNEETSAWDFVESTQPYPSWIWNTELLKWEAPVAKPNDNPLEGIQYIWNEETLTWVE